jgi:glucose-6-phosphate isomerase
MIRLKERSGLDLALDGARLLLGPDLTPVVPAVRTLEAARYTFYEPEATGPEILYWMYRSVARLADVKKLQELGLNYNITVIRPGLVGREFIKTVGHYHAAKPETDVAYPEVYEVLAGEATFLLQRRAITAADIGDVVVITAHPGDKVVMPPGYGHITINASDDYLVMSDLMAAANQSDYAEYRTRQGGAYYLIKERSEAWVRNRHYQDAPPLRRLRPRDYPEFGLYRSQPLYALLVDNPQALRFLTHPEEYEFCL